MIIPFFIPHAGCPHQCVFCDQKRITGSGTAPDPASLPEAISRILAAGRGRARRDPVQVAFYGGSFTSLPVSLQLAYLGAVHPFIERGEVASIRLSTRPDAIDDTALSLLGEHRVSVVELGAQSMDDEVLRSSGRGHTSSDTEKAVAMLKARAFSVGVQLMPGLPGDTAAGFAETVSRVIALAPSFVRVYPAIVIRDTPLERLYRSGRYAPLTLDEAVALCRGALAQFRQAGISISRIGLQSTEDLERPGTIVAGPYHPAFRQLVESSLLLETMCAHLRPGIGTGDVAFAVHPADLSSAIGQKRGNIRTIRARYGIDATVTADPGIPRGAVQMKPPC